MAADRRRRQRLAQQKSKTYQWRNWRGVNQTDARVAIDDDELYWMENAITVGKGAIQVLPAVGTSVATIAAGIASLWGDTLNGSAVMLSINTNGSISQITPGGVVTPVAVAGTVTSAAHVAMWRGTTFLIVDPTTGYHSWDGATFTTIAAGQKGSGLAVFEGRVWLVQNRTVTYTAPNTHNDFTAGNGAGSTILTDEAFEGNVIAITSALEELWLIGQGSIDAISNVQASGVAPSVTTTFAVTNIVTNLGSNASLSVIGYFRALAFLAPFGVYALSGVTPQKLSDKLDGLFPSLTLTTVSAAVAVIQSLPCLLFRVTYTGSNAQAGAGPLALILGFVQGKWFFAVQNTALTSMTTVLVSGVPQAWGTDGAAGHVFQLFGASDSTAVTWKVQSKLYDFGLSTDMHAMMKIGIEFQATGSVAPTLTVDSEFTSQTLSLSAGNTLTLVNNAGATLTILNNGGAALTLVSQGQVLSRQSAAIGGRYLGWALSGTTTGLRIQTIHFEVRTTRRWSTPQP